ncbi:MAG: class I SAM-dependent methyltransferase [Candidatus Andersenbacteria bacterium]
MYKIHKFYPANFDPDRYWEDKYAREHIAGKSTDDFRQQGFWPLLQKYFRPGRQYLDAGCGIGGWILFLRDEGYNVEGIDTAARTVRALTEYDPDIRVKVASITQIPYPDQYFDGVLAIGTLEYVEDEMPQALREVHRVLKPGGIFFMEVPSANILRRLFYIPLKRLEFLLKTRQGEKPTFAHYLFVRATLLRRLQVAQFEVLETRPHELPESHGHYGLYVDWRIFRGAEPYKLNMAGRAVQKVLTAISPWLAATGMVVVVRKRAQ